MPAQRYRCTQCGEIWPLLPDFASCPCGQPCKVASSIESMDVQSAYRRASYIRFERYLKEETPEQQDARESKSPYRKDFQRVIDGAGFQDWERRAIIHMESHMEDQATEKTS